MWMVERCQDGRIWLQMTGSLVCLAEENRMRIANEKVKYRGSSEESQEGE